jgi:autotransporter-associated beta strand protein
VTNTAAVFNLNGGVLTTPRIFTGLGSGAVSTFNFNGGTLVANTSSTTYMSGLTTANVRAGGAIIDTQANAITIAQPLLHEAALGATADGGLQKLGAGALTLTGTNTYTGATTVSNGSLLVNGTHNSAASYNVTGSAGSGATLGGSGAVNLAQAASNVALSSTSAADNAVLSPGASGAGSIGTLTVTGGGNVVLGDNSTMLVDFSGSTSDRLAISGGGAIDLTSSSNTLNLVGSGSGTYTIATFGGYNGLPGANQFENVLLNGLPTQSSNPGGDNYVAVNYNAGDITVTANVPEPGMLGLLGVVTMALLPRRRRRV